MRNTRNTRNALLGIFALTAACGVAAAAQAAELYVPGAHQAVVRRPFTFIYGASYLDNYHAKRSLVSPYGFSFGSYYAPYYYRYGEFFYRDNCCYTPRWAYR